jgi:NADH-quinone oxidoreductase subunit L
MPWTYKTFFVAALAISGIPPLSGFFSKDEILWKAFSQGSFWFWLFGWIGAGLTAFYMFRLVLLTFDGKERWSHHDKHLNEAPWRPHESTATMRVPLQILAVLSIVGGLVGIPASLGGGNAIEHFLEPIFEHSSIYLPAAHIEGGVTEYLLMILSVAMAAGAMYFARRIYLQQPNIAEEWTDKFKGFYKLLWNKYFVDEAYDVTVVTPIVKGSERLLWKWFDVGIVDGMVNGTASLINFVSGQLRKIQVGVAQSYALGFLFGIIVILGILILR